MVVVEVVVVDQLELVVVLHTYGVVSVRQYGIEVVVGGMGYVLWSFDATGALSYMKPSLLLLS